ncbi:MAG: hypothetical protein AAB611_00180 [Patescibacteria group bacterium]
MRYKIWHKLTAFGIVILSLPFLWFYFGNFDTSGFGGLIYGMMFFGFLFIAGIIALILFCSALMLWANDPAESVDEKTKRRHILLYILLSTIFLGLAYYAYLFPVSLWFR